MDPLLLSNIEEYFEGLSVLLLSTRSVSDNFSAIVNAPFRSRIDATMLDLGIIVLLLVNEKTGMIDRVALSDTHPAKGAVNISEKPFKDIKIPLENKENVVAEAIRTGKPQETADWKFLFIPDLSPRSARFNQAAAGIDCSIVYPFKNKNVRGALIYSFYQPLPKISKLHHDFMHRYTELVQKTIRK